MSRSGRVPPPRMFFSESFAPFLSKFFPVHIECQCKEEVSDDEQQVTGAAVVIGALR